MQIELPGPVPTQTDQEYWLACNRRELKLRHCLTCDRWHHPPLPMCPHCQGLQLDWRPVDGPAVLYSWTRVHVATHPCVTDALPYCIAVVEFPANSGVRLLAHLDHPDGGPPEIGAECELYWISVDGGQLAPAFRLLPRGAAIPGA